MGDKLFIVLISIFVFTISACKQSNEARVFQASQNYPEELQQLHRNVLINILDEPADLDEVEKLLSELNESGAWPYIDYSSKERGAWQPREHLTNVLSIAKAYQTKDTKFYQKEDVSGKIHRALNYWLENDFQCPNWWYPEIGVPMVLAPAMILMEAELSEKQMQRGIKILDRSEIGMTGQNKVWQSGNVLLKSLLLRDVETIRKAAESIKEELKVSKGEGIQPDWSYHQHGPQLQFGNYGLAYVGDIIKWISILRKTPFHFDERKIAILRNYMLKGLQWVTWKDQMDISACGRQLFVDSPERKASTLSDYFKKMQKIDPDYAEEYKKANRYQSLSGHKHFWRSDFQVQRNPNHYLSVKMCSERVIGAESCNSENIRGYYMGDGATFLYQSGEEYRNIFPFWDWKKIPGTTTHQDNDTLPVLTASGYRIESNFVGGVTDGKHGIAVMDYKRDGLKARKSWFMFNDVIICLGAGINSSEGVPVTTAVNQSYLKNEPIIKTSETEDKAIDQQKLTNPDWILHDSIGYMFPEGGTLKLETKKVEGSWNRVALRYPDEKITDQIFKLWFEHGINPNNRSYEYVLVPNADRTVMERMERQLPYEIKNWKNRQEIISNSGEMAGIVFYESGKSEAFGGIEVDRPCVIMLKNQAGDLHLSVADPTQLLEEMNIAFDRKLSGENAKIQHGKTKVKIDFPGDSEAGKTATVKLTAKH